MSFDYKKEYKEFYLPADQPGLVTVPSMQFLAVRGYGNPNEEGGAYQQALSTLYGLAYTLKMSQKAGHAMEGFFEYVVPPLEGFWWMNGLTGMDYAHKENFSWISVIRLPDFVTQNDFDWAVAEATRKKKADFSAAELFRYEEGLCVQCMHHGSYDNEPALIERMHAFAAEQGCVLDITESRYHHEIYLNDARKVAPEMLRTVVRHPVRKL